MVGKLTAFDWIHETRRSLTEEQGFFLRQCSDSPVGSVRSEVYKSSCVQKYLVKRFEMKCSIFVPWTYSFCRMCLANLRMVSGSIFTFIGQISRDQAFPSHCDALEPLPRRMIEAKRYESFCPMVVGHALIEQLPLIKRRQGYK